MEPVRGVECISNFGNLCSGENIPVRSRGVVHQLDGLLRRRHPETLIIIIIVIIM